MGTNQSATSNNVTGWNYYDSNNIDIYI